MCVVGGGGVHQIMPFLKPVTSMNIVITAELCDRAVVIAIKEILTRGKGQSFKQNIKRYCKRV